MSFSTPAAVTSGTPYRIVQVADAAPRDLGQFVGTTRFSIDLADGYLVCGSGRLEGDTVRFHEKDRGGTGKDVRVWTVSAVEGGGFSAEHTAVW